MVTKKAFWLSYDLGLNGDYTKLYAWLDANEAKECGNGLAFFSRTCDGDFVEGIKSEIQKQVKLKETDRIYLIHLDNETAKMKGTFLFGGRKRAVWEGFAVDSNGVEEDFA